MVSLNVFKCWLPVNYEDCFNIHSSFNIIFFLCCGLSAVTSKYAKLFGKKKVVKKPSSIQKNSNEAINTKHMISSHT